MFLHFCAIFDPDHHLQIIHFKPLAKAFLNFWIRGRSHSRKMKINGINLHSTFPGEIQLSNRCDLIGSMRRELNRQVAKDAKVLRLGRVQDSGGVGAKAPSVQPPSTSPAERDPSSKQPRLADGVVGFGGASGRRHAAAGPAVAGHSRRPFLKTVSRPRVRPATPVYTRWHRLAPVGTTWHRFTPSF